MRALPLAFGCALFAQAFAPSASADDDLRLSLHPTASAHLGYDSNARRVPQLEPAECPAPAEPRTPPAPPPAVVGDGLIVATGHVSGSAGQPGWVLTGDGSVGGKLFFDTPRPPANTPCWARVRKATSTAGERMVVAQASASLRQRLPYGFGSRIDSWAKARGQASGSRTYAVSQGRWTLSRSLGLGLNGRGGVSGAFFHSVSSPRYSSFGGGLVSGLSWAATPRESFDVEGGLLLRAHPFYCLETVTMDNGQTLCVPPDVRRSCTRRKGPWHACSPHKSSRPCHHR